MIPLITLLTDFGTDDTYVGQMKGVIAGIAPTARVIDLTHAVRPQQIEQGAFLLETAVEHVPVGAIHVAVVDPGVGTRRRALAIHTRTGGRGQYFVGPDNGLLSCAVPQDERPDRVVAIALPPGVEAVALDFSSERVVSPTFHGRDLFAVAAARLAIGTPFGEIGSRVDQMIALPRFLARRQGHGRLCGRVVHIDRFGNAVTTVHASQIPSAPWAMRVGRHRIETFVRTFGDGSGLVALVGSNGYVEIAEVSGDAAARLGIRMGQDVWVEASDE
ncbi:MAG: S-adenosyl-l-methionine hydroxide adenosyltransferase family protein [Dehalococcoidia bacterium]